VPRAGGGEQLVAAVAVEVGDDGGRQLGARAVGAVVRDLLAVGALRRRDGGVLVPA
jgi:hypothetical protein